MPRVEVVLVRPETPANVGASARVLANMGLDGLRLVNPGDFRTVECFRTAWGGQHFLESVKVFRTLGEAVADAQYVVGLSRRKHTGMRDVREMARETQELPERGIACLVFGPETSGLTQDEVAVCGRAASIPSDPAQPSLNLSHAVMVAAYEVYRARAKRVARGAPRGARKVEHKEKAELWRLLAEGLKAIHALGDTPHYRRQWEGIIQGMDLTPAQMRLLEHAARKMKRAGG